MADQERIDRLVARRAGVTPFTRLRGADAVGRVIDPDIRKARADRFKRIERADWQRLMPKLVTMARRKLGREGQLADAEDLAGKALALAIAAMDRWDPETTTLLRFAGSFLNGEARNMRRSHSLCNEMLGFKDDALADAPYEDWSNLDPSDASAAGDTFGGGAGTERAVVMRDLVARFVVLLEARLAGDEIALAVLHAYIDEVEKPQEQVERIGVPIHQITSARKRLARHAEIVFAELEGS